MTDRTGHADLPADLSDPERHYQGPVGPVEHPDLDECAMQIVNIGWTLGNDCPYRCSHCYSMSARRKGMDLEAWMVDRVVDQLYRLGIETVNLGGNEPIFTSGMQIKKSLLPYIIRALSAKGIHVGLTTSGISLVELEKIDREALLLLNDIDVSFDSPFPEEHDANRGASLYTLALRALEICERHAIDHSIIMCAMNWNFSDRHIDALIGLARQHNSHVRINPLKPVERAHLTTQLDAGAFYRGFSRLMAACDQVDLGEPFLAVAVQHPGKGCPCGRTSFRIHSITPDGKIPVSPCVYLHDYKTGDLLVDDIRDIVFSEQFRSFRRRNRHAHLIPGCDGCSVLDSCRGGCAARSYLHELHEAGRRTLFVKDPYCIRDHREAVGDAFPPFPQNPDVPRDKILVHRDYLCTWIGQPRQAGDAS